MWLNAFYFTEQKVFQIHKHWLKILLTPVLEQEFIFLQMLILHSFNAAAANYSSDKGNCGPYFKTS